tara:strand:- start:97 stop:540 length:444 start_codon:yes stop_codon:yes gene_type:complete
MTIKEALNIAINTTYPFDHPFNIKEFILKICKQKQITTGTFEFSFVDEQTITSINKNHLKHNNPTDTITFNLGSIKEPDADIYICIPIAKKNAITFKNTFKSELKLLIIHTILHTIGYTDTSLKEKKEMEQEQSLLLKQFTTKNNET